MEIIAYGEDALTLWAMTRKLGYVLNELKHPTKPPSRCQVLLRPSFGRGGGANSAKFGEFDFILLADDFMYLGESKRDRSSGITRDGTLNLEPQQAARHRVFAFYVENRERGQKHRWQELVDQGRIPPDVSGDIAKPVAPATSLLAANLQTVLGIVRDHYKSVAPTIVDVVLYFHHQDSGIQLPASVTPPFQLVKVDYTEIANDNFIRLQCDA